MKPAKVMPASSFSARCTSTAPPASPKVNEASSRLAIVRTWRGRVAAELGDVLAAHDKRVAGGAATHPVVGHEDAGEYPRAGVGDIDRRGVARADRRRDGDAHRRLEPVREAVSVLRDAAIDDQVDVLGLAVPPREAILRRADCEGEGVLLAGRHPALVDAGEPLEIDTGLVPGRRHELGRREMGLR